MPKKPPRDDARIAQQKALGARVQYVLDELGWSRQRGADAIGFSAASTLSNIANGYNGIDAIDLWNFARKTGYPYQWFVDANYAPAERWPRTKLDWELLAGPERKRHADAHWKVEEVLGAYEPTEP